jgi:ubiquinone/menaquinone biosynthesis C-methylase UbiE
MSDYDRFARLYDLEHAEFDADLLLYQNLAQRCGSPVLDVGCGSGRVALALAKSGLDVTGIDNSPAMLDIARVRLREDELPGQIHLVEQDVCDLEWESRFPVAVFALNGFLHLLTPTAQRAALQNLYRALLPGGVLIVDVPNPRTVFTARQDGKAILRSHFHLPEGGEAWCFVNAQTDLAAQIQHLTLTYDELFSSGQETEMEDWPGEPKQDLFRRTVIAIDVRFVYCREMTGLLEQAGFRVDGVYGSYDLDPYQDSSHVMLFVAYRPSRENPGFCQKPGF